MTQEITSDTIPELPAPPTHDELTEPLGFRLLKRAIRENCFYPLSAVLMLLGCYLLMYSEAVVGTPFARTLQALAILQGYELLVIASAALIVMRLKLLDDAFILLLVEFAILLDPTLFSSHFAVMFYVENELTSQAGNAVNVVCFVLAPLKLAILLYALRLQLSRGGWGAFLFAAFFVYLAQIPLNEEHPLHVFTPSAFFCVLVWTPFVFACLLPRLERLVRVAGERAPAGADGAPYLAPERHTLLCRMLLGVPLVIFSVHLFNSALGYATAVHFLHLAPLPLAAGVLLLKNRRTAPPWKLVLALDGLALLALLVSADVGHWRIDLQPSHEGVKPVAPFILAGFPLIICGAAVVGLYGYAWRRLRYRPALHRIYLLVALGAGLELYQLEVVRELVAASSSAGGDAVQACREFIGGLGIAAGRLYRWLLGLATGAAGATRDFVFAHPDLALAVLWAALLAVACRYRHYLAWFFCGLVLILLAFGALPGGRSAWIPEILQSALILVLAVDHWFNRDGDVAHRALLAFILALFGVVRFGGEPATWSAAVVVAECLALVAAGLLLRYRPYATIGIVQAALFLLVGGYLLQLHTQPAMMALLAALTLFGVGLTVTFNKKAIIHWLEE